MVVSGAPPQYLAINAIALGLALGLIHYEYRPKTELVGAILTLVAIGILVLPILFGPDIGGIRRWIGMGPLHLHSGMLVLPVLIMLLPQVKSNHQMLAMAIAAILISCQPDRASASALVAGAGALLLMDRSASNVIQLIFACFAVLATFIQPDDLQPVIFVENVLPDTWLRNPMLASLLAASLVAVVIVPAVRSRQLIPLTATFAAFTLASLLGNYPVPLVGHGAAPILGFGFAVAVTRSKTQAEPYVNAE